VLFVRERDATHTKQSTVAVILHFVRQLRHSLQRHLNDGDVISPWP
jgi:hypothetical protein